MRSWYLGLGSNLGESRRVLSEALANLGKKCHLLRISSLYITEPQDYKEQANFYNAVALCKTNLEPFELLSFCKDLELLAGRTRGIPKGPRSLDLDLLCTDDYLSLTTPELVIPHPAIQTRRFVLEPLCELQANLMLHPYGQTVKTLIREVQTQGIYAVFRPRYTNGSLCMNNPWENQ